MTTNILDILIRAAREIGAMALDRQSTARIAVDKGDLGYATDADLEARRILKSILGEGPLNLPILSEEQPSEEQDSIMRQESFVCCDELDGTSEYLNQGPNWGPIIGVVQAKVLTQVVMYLPGRDILITAERGRGCHINGNPASLQGIEDIRQGSLCILFKKEIPRDYHETVYTPLCYETSDVYCPGNSIASLELLLRGYCAGYICYIGRIWDFLGALCVQEAGGVALHPDGSELTWDKIPMSILAACNRKIANQMLAISDKYDYSKHTWR